MKMLRYWFLSLILSAMSQVAAQNSPSDEAIRAGFRGIQEMQNALFPLTHRALPQKDYTTLLTSGLDLKRAAFAYSKVKFKTHNPEKNAAFQTARDSLSGLVIAYADAADRYDTTAIRALLPEAEAQFELSATALLAYRWTEFDRLYAAVEPFYEAVVSAKPPAENQVSEKKKGTPPQPDRARTLDSISALMAAWVASPIPKEVEYRSTLIGEEQAVFTRLVGDMKSSLTVGDTTKFRSQLTNLKVRLRNFTRSYLQ